jgi:hypothetical protein
MDARRRFVIVLDFSQRQLDCLRHADDQVQASFFKHIPKRPGRDNHSDPSPVVPGAANGADHRGQSGAVNEAHTGQVDDQARFTQAQGNGPSESRDGRGVQVSFWDTDEGAMVRDYLDPEHRLQLLRRAG